MRTQLLFPVIGALLAGAFVGGMSYFAPSANLQKTGLPSYAAEAGLAQAGSTSSVVPQSIGSASGNLSLLLQLASVILASVLVAGIVSLASARRKENGNPGTSGTSPAE